MKFCILYLKLNIKNYVFTLPTFVAKMWEILPMIKEKKGEISKFHGNSHYFYTPSLPGRLK